MKKIEMQKEIAMKQKTIGTIAGIVLAILSMAVLALPLFSQKGFNMDENELVLSYKRANPLYLDGEKQFSKGNLDKAEKKLLEALALMPEHADASYVLAQVQLKRKDFPKALALIIDAEKHYASISRFRTFTHQQYLDRLRQQRQNLEDMKNQILANLSRTSKSESSAATREIDQNILVINSRLSTPIPPTYEIPADYYYIHGNALFQLGRRADAEVQYREAIRVDPTHGNAYNNLALVLFSLGRFQEALDCLQRAEAAGVKINPDFKRDLEAKIPK
ncbi:MAG: tetratricopeptide repeat protein [Acidobacteriota bacterium]|jgi:tetratricopeptide (TPR) repeat protein|nr:tetratricopeptide repeat protein [Acidobacteriota bacterium]